MFEAKRSGDTRVSYRSQPSRRAPENCLSNKYRAKYSRKQSPIRSATDQMIGRFASLYQGSWFRACLASHRFLVVVVVDADVNITNGAQAAHTLRYTPSITKHLSSSGRWRRPVLVHVLVLQTDRTGAAPPDECPPIAPRRGRKSAFSCPEDSALRHVEGEVMSGHSAPRALVGAEGAAARDLNI